MVYIRVGKRRGRGNDWNSNIIRNAGIDHGQRAIAYVIGPLKSHGIHGAIDKRRIIGQCDISMRSRISFCAHKRLDVR